MLGARKLIAAVRSRERAARAQLKPFGACRRPRVPMDQSLRRVPMSPHAYDPDSDPEDDADERKEKEPVDEAPQEPITPAEPLTTVHHANIDEPSPRHPSVD